MHLEGTLWDPKMNQIHSRNQQIKRILRDRRLTQKQLSLKLNISISRLSKDLNSALPLPEWLESEILTILAAEYHPSALQF